MSQTEFKAQQLGFAHGISYMNNVSENKARQWHEGDKNAL